MIPPITLFQAGTPGSPVLGIHALPRKILGVPEGAKVRVRMRNLEVATVYFRYGGMTCRFKATWAAGGHWQISAFTGVNATLQAKG